MDNCIVPPPGWRCTRAAGHDGPCAAIPSYMSPNATLWREIDALGGSGDAGHSEALDKVLAILERRGFSEHADPTPNTDTPTDEYRRGGWQSIESAPKDGTHILAWFWSAVAGSSYGWADTIRWWNGMWWDDREGPCEPCAWMPRPAPPSIRALSPEPLGTAKERGE